MKKFLLRSFLLLGLSGLPQLSAQSITFTGCENQGFISGYTLSASGNITDAGIDRTVYKSNPAQGSFGELIIIKWNATEDQWEILFNSFDGDDGPNNELLYTSTVATYPNPPNIAIGNWTNADTYGCDPLDATHGELSGDVADTPPDLPPGISVSGLPTVLTFEEDAQNTELNISDMEINGGGPGDYIVSLIASSGRYSLAAPGGLPISPTGNNTGTVTFTGPLADIVHYLTIPSNIWYLPQENLNGNGAATITLTIKEAGAPDGTVINLGTIQINITPVNDNPVAVEDEVTTDENTPVTGNVLTNDTDIDGDALTASLVTAPVNGTVVLNADGSFTYTPNANYSGPDSLQYQVCDNGTPSLCDTTAVKFTIAAAINNAPVIAAPAGINVDEDVATALTGISFSDADAGNGQVTVILSVPGGTLSATSGGGVTVSGSGTGALMLTGSIADINAFIAAGGVGFTTAANETDNIVLTVNINDNGNTGSGGSQQDTATVTLSVTAVNDAPVNTVPGEQAVDRDGVLVFSTGNGNDISIADVDAGAGTVRVTLTATNGSITLGSTTGLSFISGSGTADDTMTFEGSITDINFALNGMSFAPTAGYSGPASLQVVTNDLGLSGSGGGQTDTDTINITVNTSNPEVTTVNVNTADGTYKTGDVLAITITFDQAVSVNTSGGSPSLLLETGSMDRQAVYVSGSGSDILVFNYTVQAGDMSADLDYTSTAALALNGSTIRNGTGDDADLTLPDVGSAHSIAGQHHIAIDGVAPTVTLVNVPANGYYNTGDALTFMLDFNENVTVGGTPSLDLTVGNTSRQAQYISGSGSTTLLFRYTVQEGDNDTDGIVLNNLSLNGGTIRDSSGNDAVLTLNNIPDLTNVRINTTVPTVTVSTAASSPVNMAFTATITFSEAVTGFTLTDINSTNTTIANLQTNDNITYTVTVTPGADGEVTLQVPAGAAQNIGENGNSASNTLSVIYDGTAPAVSSVNVPANGYYQNGDIMDFTVQFNENVNVGTGGGMPYLGLTVGTASREAGYISGGGTNVLLFRYVVQPDDKDLDGISLGSTLVLNGSIIHDTAGNNASLALNNMPPTNNILVYSAAPSVTLSGTPGVNTAFTMTVTFSEAVTGFTAGDINTTNAILSNLQTSDNIVYTVLVTPNADGPVSLQVPADVATNIAGNGNTESNIFSYDYDATAPGVPEGLEAVPGDGEVILNWTANTESDLAGYKIYGGTTANPGILLETADAPLTTYTHSGLTNGTLYYYRISAVDEAGNESGETADVNARPRGNQTISFNALTDRTYGDASFGLTATTSSGLTVSYTSSDPAVASVSGNELTIHGAGTVEITASQAGDDTYNAAMPVVQSLVINPKAITVTAEDKTKVYGEDDPELTYTYNPELVAGDNFSGVPERAPGEDIGTYAIAQGTLALDSNYELTFESAQLTITPAAITGITFNDGSFVYDGVGKSLSVTGDLPSGTMVNYTNNIRTDVGTQEVTATITGANYETLVLTADLTITTAAITGITFADGSFVYDGVGKSLSVTGDLPSGTMVNYTNNIRTDVGTQEVTATITGANYETLVLTADLTITPNVITGITFNDGSFVYDGTARSLSIEGMLPEGTSVSYTGNSRTEVGTQEVTATITGANYETLVLTADLEITPLAITVTADDKEKVYGATDPELTYTYTPELVTGDSFSGTLVREAGEEAGTYTINLGTLALNANYMLTFESATLEISKAPVNNITFHDAVFVYDGTLHQLAITGTLPEGASVSYENNGRTDAGMQEVTATVTGANYETLVLTAVLTVEKAPQVIDFAPVADKDLENDPDFQLEATASSGLPVSYTYTYLSADPPAVVSPDGMVSLLSSGEVEITAHQEGNANYLPADVVTRILHINSSNASVSTLEINGTVYDNPGQETYYIMDCDNFAPQAEVQIHTADPNATVDPGRIFVIDTPEAGLYRREVTVTSQNGEQIRTYLVTVERRFNFDDIVEQKFNNVLLVNNNPTTNGGYKFVKFEWFKNGKSIGTGQYYSAGDNKEDLLDPTARYSVRMTTDTGDVLTTCGGEIMLEASLDMKAYPNPVLSGELLHILADLPEEELSHLTINVYNQNGREVLRTTGREKETAVSLPRIPGVYLVSCRTNQRKKTFKIIVK